MLANSVIDLIGNTPLVKINNIDTFGNEIYIKLEGINLEEVQKTELP